jgi:hypothetical protein
MLMTGAAAGVLYLALAVASFTFGSLPTLPLYDGAVLGPYRFVDPPKPFAEFNMPPYNFRERFPLNPDRFEAVTAATIDNHSLITLPEGIVKPRPGETEIEVTIDPLAPKTLGPPPPGTGYDGNAYRFTARYAASRDPVEFRGECPADEPVGSSPDCATVIIHYAFGGLFGRGATKLYRHSDEGWHVLPSRDVKSQLHAFGATGMLGTFVAAGPNRPGEDAKSAFPTKLAIGLGAGGLVAGLLLSAKRVHSIRAGRSR